MTKIGRYGSFETDCERGCWMDKGNRSGMQHLADGFVGMLFCYKIFIPVEVLQDEFLLFGNLGIASRSLHTRTIDGIKQNGSSQMLGLHSHLVNTICIRSKFKQRNIGCFVWAVRQTVSLFLYPSSHGYVVRLLLNLGIVVDVGIVVVVFRDSVFSSVGWMPAN